MHPGGKSFLEGSRTSTQQLKTSFAGPADQSTSGPFANLGTSVHAHMKAKRNPGHHQNPDPVQDPAPDPVRGPEQGPGPKLGRKLTPDHALGHHPAAALEVAGS